MVKYRAALWSFLKLTALVFYHVWHSPLVASEFSTNVFILLFYEFMITHQMRTNPSEKLFFDGIQKFRTNFFDYFIYGRIFISSTKVKYYETRITVASFTITLLSSFLFILIKLQIEIWKFLQNWQNLFWFWNRFSFAKRYCTFSKIS